MRKLGLIGIVIFGSVLGSAADYVSDGPDAGRTGWLKDEKVFNKTNVKGMKLLWKVKLDSTPRDMHNLFTPIVLSNVNTGSGPKEIVVVAGVSDDLWAIDTASGKQLWHKNMGGWTLTPGTDPWRTPYTLCPGGQLATPAAMRTGEGKFTIYALGWDGRLRSVNAADGEDLAPPEKFMPPNTKPWSLNIVDGVVYTSISQGCGGQTNSIFSYDTKTRISSAFIPGGGGLWGRRGVAVAPDGVAWMGTGDGYYNAATKNLGDSLVGVKLDANHQLQLAGWFAPPNVNWLWHRDLDINVSPVAIDYKGRHLLFGTSKECRLWMVDRDVVSNTDPAGNHQTMIDRTPLICNPGARFDAAGVWGAFAVYEEAGQLYVAVPFLGPLAETWRSPTDTGHPELGGVAVLRVDTSTPNWKLTPVWSYGDIDQGDEAIYANGVLFVDAAGEDTNQRRPDLPFDAAPEKTAAGAGTRILNSRRAAIYAFDASNGKLLWSSGDQIASFSHGAGMSAVNGKAYVDTYDGYLYCFGVAK